LKPLELRLPNGLTTIVNTVEQPSVALEETVRAYPLVRRGYAMAAAIAILGGVMPRLDHLGRSLWAAEAWVANSVLASSWHGMFYYESWLQTTPPLFLLLVRASVKLFGLSDYSLRAVPFLFSVAALILIASLARKMFLAPFAVLCIALMAVSPSAILFSKELKQYSSDVFAACMILLVLWEYLHQPDRRRYFLLLLAFTVTLPLSYTTVIFVPLALWAVGLSEPKAQLHVDQRCRIVRCGALALLVSAIAGIDYCLFIKPNTSPLLRAFWDHAFPHFAQLRVLVRFYLGNCLAMGVYFYFPAQSSTKDTLRSLVLSLPAVIQFALGITVVLLTATLIVALRRGRTYRLATLFFVLPFLTLIALNMARLYPVGSRRLTLFMLPSVIIITTASIEALWTLVLVPRLPECTARRVLVMATVLCLLSVLVLGYRAAGWDVNWTEDEDTESAFRYLRSSVQAADTIYVHASVEEAARLYFKMLRWNTAQVRYGNTGLPCCKRQREVRPQDSVVLRAYVVRGFENAMTGRTPGSVWLVYTARAEHWRYLNLNEASIIQDRLQEAGCTKQHEQYFENEVVDKYKCVSVLR